MPLLTPSGDCDNQVPRILYAPESEFSRGKKFVAISELCGLHLDPWEKLVIHLSQRTDPASQRLLGKIVALIVSRQNGKGSILEALGLGWLFVTQEEMILHSAHQFKTAADSYKRLARCIKRVPELEAMVGKFSNSHGNEGIVMKDGREYKFIARAGGSGRGFPAKKAVFDEAYDVDETELEDILPTLTSSPDGQSWFTSSAVNKEKHPNGRTLSKLRWQAIRQSNPLLCFMEWSVPEDLSPLEYHKREWWRYANPGWEYRPDMPSALEADFSLMSLRSFGQEHLGVGDYFPEDDGGKVITQDQWNDLEDPESRIVGKRVFAVHVAAYGQSSAVAVCGFNRAGRFHVEVMRQARGTRWVVEYLKERCERWHPIAVAYDPRTASASLEHDMIDAKLPLEPLKGNQVPQAFSEFYDKCVHAKSVRHPNQPSVNEALLAAEARNVGDGGLIWDTRKPKSDIAGLVAITNALWLFSMKCTGIIDVASSVW